MTYAQRPQPTDSRVRLIPPSSLAMSSSLPSLGLIRRVVLRLGAVLLVASLALAAVPSAYAQSASRLMAFENNTLDGKQVPFAIEEMQVGDIRHIIDYLLLHGRFNAQNGETSLASAQLQWAASLMDLNAGLANTPAQDAVRKAAAKIDALSRNASSNPNWPASADNSFFEAHHALAKYHQRRAMSLLASTTPTSQSNKLVRQNAIFQEKAGLALSAALTHFDRAVGIRADLHGTPVAETHLENVDRTYTMVEALRVASGQVDAEKATTAAKDLGKAIAALRLE